MKEIEIRYINGDHEIYPGTSRACLDPITGFYDIRRTNMMGDPVRVLINMSRVNSITIIGHMESEKDEKTHIL